MASQERMLGVLFVHGVLSSPAMWDSFAELIAGDEELQQVGVRMLRFEYATGAVKLHPLQVLPSLDTVADSLKEYLVTEAGSFERLVLVGHSMGGLVIQRCLVRMLAEGRSRELERIKQVVLLATPNTGSQLLLGLRRRLLRRNPQEKALRPFDEQLADTRRTLMRDIIHATTVTERSCPIPFSVYAGESDGVVPSASARDAFPDAAALPGDHASIARPTSREHRSYTTVKRLLLDAADRDPPATVAMLSQGALSVQSLPSAAVQRRSRLAGERALKEHWDPRGRGVERAARPGWFFTGRRQALSLLVAWLSAAPDPAHNVRVITGGPGSGKSAVLARLVTMSDPGYRVGMPVPLPVDDPVASLRPGTISVAVHAREAQADEVVGALAAAANAPQADLDGLIDRLVELEEAFTVVVARSMRPTTRGHWPRRCARWRAKPLMSASGCWWAPAPAAQTAG